MEEATSIIEYSADIADQLPPEPLPAGSYPAQITGAEVKTSQAGNRYAAVTFHINVDDYPADYPVENNPDGVQIIYRRAGLMDTNQSRYGLKKFCEAVGAPMSTRIDLNDWLGLEAIVNVELDEWDGSPRANIASLEAA